MVNNPNIRFAGFSDEWLQRKLGELYEKGQAGGTPSTTNASYYGGSIPFLSISDVTKAIGEIYDTEKHITSEGLDSSSAWIVPKGAISLSMYASVGKLAILGVNLATSQAFYNMVFSDDSVRNFVYHRLIKAYDDNEWNQFVSTGTQSNLNGLKVKSFEIMCPDELKEQQKIGSVFSKLDHKIGLEERQISLLKDLKKGYLQKMFPKDGATEPEIRFKGFTNAWEQRKLGDEVRIVMGQSPNSENYTDDPNDYILVQGNADMKNGRVSPRVWTTQVTKQAEKDDLILTVRAPVGDIGKTAYDVVIGRGVAAIKGNEFIFQNLGKMKSDGYWTRYSTGSTFESINSTDIKEAIISVPTIEEQNKMGLFFKQLDNTIALHQRKLDLLKDLKKGLSQQMFV